jgi:hypothetical protein
VPSIFFSYSHADEGLRDQLEKQLVMLKRQGVIDTWHDRRIVAGQDINLAIDQHINSDEIILLLVSSDFLASKYCYDIEMKQAMGRQEAGEAVVIPVILRACDWRGAPFGMLNATPRDGKPITQWADIDEAFLQVATAVREAAVRLAATADPSSTPSGGTSPSSVRAGQSAGPRSSNLRLAKAFTQREKDQFQLDTFEYIGRFSKIRLQRSVRATAALKGFFAAWTRRGFLRPFIKMAEM